MFGVYDYGCNLWWDCKLLVRRPTLGKCKSWIGRLQEGERCTTGGQTNKSRDDRNKELGLNFINCSASGRIHFFRKQHDELFRRLSGSSSRVGHSFWFYVDSFLSKSDNCPWQLLVDGLIWAMLLKAQKLNFGQNFECKGWSKFWSWILINLLYDLKAVNLVRTLSPCDRCSFCNVCILWCKVKERNDDAPDNYNSPVHLVHQADLNALAQARVGRWWILRREGRTGNHRHHQHSTLFSTPLPSESIISNILSIFYTFLPSAQGSLSSAKIEF